MTCAVQEHVNKFSSRNYFKNTPLSPWVRRELDDLNKKSHRKWKYDHVLSGFLSASAPEYVEGETPVLGDIDVFRILNSKSSSVFAEDS